MNRCILVFPVIFFLSGLAPAQDCPDKGIEFSTQAEIDSFNTDYPGCTEITGDVQIEGSDITNLDGLSGIVSIDGDLDIVKNEALTSLAGLGSLTTVTGDFAIEENDLLTDLSGIGTLTISKDLDIFDNPALVSLVGLENTTVGEVLSLGDNVTLSTCNLQRICGHVDSGGNVSVSGNATGCSDEAELTDACTAPLSLELTGSNQKFIIKINSSSGRLHLVVPQQDYRFVKVYDSAGQLYRQYYIREISNELDISGLARGIIFVAIISENQRLLQKLINL